MWACSVVDEADSHVDNSKLIWVLEKEIAHWQAYARFDKLEYLLAYVNFLIFTLSKTLSLDSPQSFINEAPGLFFPREKVEKRFIDACVYVKDRMEEVSSPDKEMVRISFGCCFDSLQLWKMIDCKVNVHGCQICSQHCINYRFM